MTARGRSPARSGQEAAEGVGGAANELAAVIILMNQAVNRFLGIPASSRRDLSTEEQEKAMTALESIGDEVQADGIKRVA